MEHTALNPTQTTNKQTMGYKTAFFKFGGGGGAATVTVNYTLREYSRTETWTKPNNLIGVEVFMLGAGGGGGSGAVRPSSVTSRAGGGGGGGNFKWGWIDADELSATEPIVVGDGGAGGAAVTTSDTANNSGGNGGYTSFGLNTATGQPFFDAYSGYGGTENGGVAFGPTIGNPTSYPHQTNGPIGINSSTSGAAGSQINRQSQFDTFDYPSATAGGGVRNNNQAQEGGVGSGLLDNNLNISTSPLGGAAGGGNGANGAENIGTFLMAGPLMWEQNLVGVLALGTTGGGGGGNNAGNGGNAGTSGAFGTGGSGGGATRDGFSSGAGANGTTGFIKILEVTYSLS